MHFAQLLAPPAPIPVSRISMVYRSLACSVLFVFAAAPLGAQVPAGKEELKLKLPKPMFIGTPTNLRSPNLEKVTGKSRAAIYVPKGTVLLSLKKKITSSDSAPVIGELVPRGDSLITGR